MPTPTSRKPRVFIAGPYIKSDPEYNTRRAIEVGDFCLKHGMIPYVPHAHTHWWNKQIPHEEPIWIEMHLAFVPTCDALFRMQGHSTGADREADLARTHGIPVFERQDELVKWAAAFAGGELKSQRCGPVVDCEPEGCELSPPPSYAEEGDPRFIAEVNAIKRLHAAKQGDYGKQEDAFANLRASAEFGVSPWLGAVLRLHDKITRIKSLVRNGRLRNESIVDSFRDISVYALIAKILYLEEHPEEATADARC